MSSHYSCAAQNMGGEGNPWKSYKLTQDPPDTSIILFDGYSCHGEHITLLVHVACRTGVGLWPQSMAAIT